MRPRMDLTAAVFGRLYVICEASPSQNGGRRWLCRCECGNEKIVLSEHLRSGATKSCGCLMREVAAELLRSQNLRHGLSTRLNPRSEVEIWRGMKRRCMDTKHKSFARYGGRGIRVCERWMNSVEAFVEDMGPRPSPAHSIDRIDSDGDYEPGNCRWATASEQRRNQKHGRCVRWFVTPDDERLTLSEVANRLAIRVGTLWTEFTNAGVF